MSYFENLKDVKSRVQKILSSNLRARDNDNILLATYYCHEYGGVEALKGKNAYDLLDDIAKGRLDSFESIGRARRKLQEQNPELRGEKYITRQEAEKEVRENIKNL